jgi:hypothetical protein
MTWIKLFSQVIENTSEYDANGKKFPLNKQQKGFIEGRELIDILEGEFHQMNMELERRRSMVDDMRKSSIRRDLYPVCGF